MWVIVTGSQTDFCLVVLGNDLRLPDGLTDCERSRG